MTHRGRVDALVAAYLGTPVDRPAGDATAAAEDFARFAAARGSRVRVVHARHGEDPACPTHAWVRVLNVEGIHGYDVDVSGDRDGESTGVLVWRMDGGHPGAGVFRSLRVAPAVPAAG